MPYEPPPELAGLSLAEIAELVAARKLPPVDQWNPERSGDSLMRIAADGRWYHDGGEITRPAMVRAFASLLLKDEGGQHWLVTPQEKLSIEVEDAAFIAIDVKRDGDALAFRLNTDDLVIAGPNHPIRAAGDPEVPALYLGVRQGTEARLNRSTYAQLVDIALENGNLRRDQPGHNILAGTRMSAVFDRVSQLYREGQHGDPPELFADQRLEGVTEFRSAAVLVAFTERAEGPGILLLHRPSTMRSHPGQIAFPGGSTDPGETPIEAALRETWEELGIRQHDVRVIGAGDVYYTHSGFEITPVIGVVPADIEINPNPVEVAQWFEAPASFLLDPTNHKQQWIEWEGSMRAYYEIDWQGHQTWGITAAIIVNLSRRLRWNG